MKKQYDRGYNHPDVAKRLVEALELGKKMVKELTSEEMKELDVVDNSLPQSDSPHEIFKVQVPLNPGAENTVVLVYNEDKSIYRQIPITAVIILKMDGKPKDFFYGHFRKGNFVMGFRAPWQNW